MIEWAKIFIDAGRAAIGVPAAAYAISSIGLNLQFGYTDSSTSVTWRSC